MRQFRRLRQQKGHPLALVELSLSQLEQAFLWLASPERLAPPRELQELSQVEWFLVQKMLEGLQQEKEMYPLQ